MFFVTKKKKFLYHSSRESFQQELNHCFALALNAAAQGERDAFLLVGGFYEIGDVGEKNAEKSRENFRKACSLGSVEALSYFGWLLDNSDPERWYWWAKAAAEGSTDFFFNLFPDQVLIGFLSFTSFPFSNNPQVESGNCACVFTIGKSLHGQIDEANKTILGSTNRNQYDSVIYSAQKAVNFFLLQCLRARKAVDCWSIVAKHLGVVKDIRILIAKLVWHSRIEITYNK